MKTKLLLLAVVVCAVAAGCEDSKSPLSDPQASKPDQRLLGVWQVEVER